MRSRDVANVWQAITDGDYLSAYDLASSALERHGSDPELRYLLVLALARAHSPDRAQAEYRALQTVDLQRHTSPRLRQDIVALGARLTKDKALRASRLERRRLARVASLEYEAVHRRFGSVYACVNAATLALVARQTARAHFLSEETLAQIATTPRRRGSDAYWDLASEAEACLVAGDVERGRSALERAARLAPGTGAVATTRGQLALVCTEAEYDLAVLDALPLPTAVHYVGHLAVSPEDRRFSSAGARHITADLVSRFQAGDVGWAYGSLAGGADIVVAETMLDLGAELHVVLPFAIDEFERVSVTRAGLSWTKRFRRCLERSTSVVLTSDSGYSGDSGLFDHCSRVAMGKAIGRARSLMTNAQQIAVWDERPDHRGYGTAQDVATWRACGFPTHIVRMAPESRAVSPVLPRRRSQRRRVRAVLFADFRGFSRLYDEQFTVFVQRVLRPLGRVLDRYGTQIQRRMSWGDALQVVFADVPSAAACALDLQAQLSRLDFRRLGLPPDLGLRISLHAGPVLALEDPIRDEPGFYGREFTRAARIEPRTPEGSVYVTEVVAALLALEPASGLRTEYVGRITTAKDFETIPMYVVLSSSGR